MAIQEKFETLLNKFTKPSDLAGEDGSKVAETGNYNHLTGKPTKVSEFSNDSGYITSSGTANPVTIHSSGFSPGPTGNTTFTVAGTKNSGGELLTGLSATSQSFLIPYFTVDAKGRVTGYSNKTISLSVSSTNNYSNYYNYSNYQSYSNYYSYSNYRNYNNYSAYTAYSNYGAYTNYVAYGNYGNYYSCNCTP